MRKQGIRSSQRFDKEMLSNDLLDKIAAQGYTESVKPVSISEWVKTLIINGQPLHSLRVAKSEDPESF